MLSSLRIVDFAIIDEVQIEFDSGMSVLTGETGAGKSIIIDAISLLMGARATSFMVKSGAKKALVEGVFDIAQNYKLQAFLQEAGFESEDELVISREISAEGKSQARLNYRLVSAGLLKQIGQHLADIHSQFETQYLLNDKIHLSLLDNYIGSEMTELLKAYQQAYKAYSDAKKDYETLLNTPSDEEQIDFYKAKLQEIDEADLHEGEIEALEAEKKRMSEFEKTNAKLVEVLHYLSSDRGAIDQLYQAEHIFSNLEDEQLANLQERMSDLYYQLTDMTEEIESFKDELVFDEYRYEEIQNRLFLIRKLQRQYGYDVAMILAKRDEFEEKISLIENKESLLLKKEKELALKKDEATKIAKQISILRQNKAKLLESDILAILADLYMENTQFSCEFQKSAVLSETGIDHMSFMISTNVGQKLQKLSDVASGGELSRLMLGMKCIFTKSEGVSTIIFDEVDTGVSGKVAFAIGRKMKEIAKNAQVICITHLPQVASFAKNHLFVYKHLVDERTKTEAKWLSNEERVEEIAKMLSNDTINSSALENARYLLNENGKN